MILLRVEFLLCVIVATLLMSLSASAQSLTGNVGSAGISDGEQAIEARVGLNDAGDAGARVHYDYSFTDWYQLRVITSFSRPDGDDIDFSSFTVSSGVKKRKMIVVLMGAYGSLTQSRMMARLMKPKSD